MDLKPGANDVRALAPGVYFVREAQAQAQEQQAMAANAGAQTALPQQAPIQQ